MKKNISKKLREKNSRNNCCLSRIISCGIFIINPKRELLLVHATVLEKFGKYNPLKDPTKWGIPKGKQELDETFWETAVREIMEETSIDISKIKGTKIELDFIEYTHKHKSLKPFIYIAQEELPKSDKLYCLVNIDNTTIPEIDAYLWKNLDIIKEKDLHYTQFKILEKVKNACKI